MAQPESQFFKLTLKLELMFNLLMLSYRYKIIVDDLSLLVILVIVALNDCAHLLFLGGMLF